MLIIGRIVAWLIVVAAAITVFAPVWHPGEHLAILAHHLAHTIILAGGATLGLAIVQPRPQPTERAQWLIPAIGASIVVMLLMWPSLYELTESSLTLHILDHLALGVCGFIAAYAGQRYRVGAGWILAGVVMLMAITAAGGFGGLIRDSYPHV